MTGEGTAPTGAHVSGRFPELEVALCERVTELRRDQPLAPLTIVVGSAAVRTHISDLLVRTLGAVANINIITLTRLAANLVAEAQGAPPAVLAGLARERFLRRLIAREAGKLGYFGPVVERPHFAEALAATFADLREASVAPDAPWRQAATAVTDASANGLANGAASQRGSAKAADLDLLYRAYCRELDVRGLLDGAAVQLAAAQAVPACRSLGKTILYGIYDLNQVQETLVGALIAAGADVFEPVPRDGARLNEALLGAARAAGLAERPLAAPAAHRNLDRVATVWRDGNAAARERLAFEPGDQTLTVASVSDERAETREALRAIIETISATGVALWDCAIVVPNGDDRERVAAALQAAGLPVACRRPDRSPGPRLLLRLADCLAPPSGEPFARRAVINLFAAAPLLHAKATPVEMALWLDEARQAGIVSGLDQWKERVGRRARGLEHRLAELESRPGVTEVDDDEAVEKITAVRLHLAAARGLETAVGALARACNGLPAARASWGAWADALAAVPAALFESSAAEPAADAAGRLRGLAVVDEEVDVAEAAGVLRQLLADGSVPSGRVGRDGVAVLTPLELRGLSFHTIVFTGLAEGGFPTRGRPDPILGDAQRGRIAKALGVRLPVAEQRGDEGLLLFAFACEAARERLVLIAPRTEAATGRPRLPSRLLLKLASLAAARPVGLDEFLDHSPLAPVWRRISAAPAHTPAAVWVDQREYDTAALLDLSEHARASAAPVYLSEVLADDPEAARRLGAWRAARDPEPGPWDGLLGAPARAALAARHPFDGEMSPTRMERYITCPFAFLLRDVFGLDAPDEPGDSLEIDNLEFGSLAHKILQLTYSGVIERGLPLDGALATLDDAWGACCAEAEEKGVTGADISWRVRREMLRDDLRESLRLDPLFAGGGDRAVAVEWGFGESYDRPVTLELGDGRTVRFRGRLDRVDETSRGARVIDYKTGAGTTEEYRIKDGLSVQLAVYQLAVRQAGAEDYEAITCLYRLVTRRGGFRDLELKNDEAAAAARLRDLAAGAAAAVDRGMFPRTTRGRCDYCDVRYACGVSPWARARKREHDVLAPLRALQGPPAAPAPPAHPAPAAPPANDGGADV